jgi:hypothetical protein
MVCDKKGEDEKESNDEGCGYFGLMHEKEGGRDKMEVRGSITNSKGKA